MSDVQISAEHRKIVEKILSTLDLPIYVFGSRAKGTARRLSDLDLCIKSEADLSDAELRSIRDAKNLFEESRLPFKVDLVIWSELSREFQRHIIDDLVLF